MSRGDTWSRKRRAEVPSAWWREIESWCAWLAASGLPPTTRRLRRWQLRNLAEHHPDCSPWDLTTDDLARYLGGHQWAPETLKSARGSVRAFYAWAAATDRIPASPAAILPPVRVPDGVPRPVAQHAIDAALSTADDRTRLMLRLASLAGLRAGEVARLAWTDVEVDRLVVRGKGGRVRVVPLHPDLASELNAERERRTAGHCGSGHRYTSDLDRWVFPGQRPGQPLTAGSVSKILGDALGDASAHQLRHRFASNVYAGTRDLLAVQALLGHASVTTTVRYTALPQGALERAVLAA